MVVRPRIWDTALAAEYADLPRGLGVTFGDVVGDHTIVRTIATFSARAVVVNLVDPRPTELPAPIMSIGYDPARDPLSQPASPRNWYGPQFEWILQNPIGWTSIDTYQDPGGWTHVYTAAASTVDSSAQRLVNEAFPSAFYVLWTNTDVPHYDIPARYWMEVNIRQLSLFGTA